MSEIVGREAELTSLAGFVGDAGGGPAALVLQGEAGIGKSTLWLAGTEMARARGMHVLSSRPAEPERALAHAGLGDLFESIVDRVLDSLSPPRRRALEMALLLKDNGEGVVDPRALGIATRSVLQVLAAERPVLVAIDDLQWLDASSGAALAFALRRLGRAQVRLLLARRLSSNAQWSVLERALSREAVQRLMIGPLSLGALHGVLRDRLGKPFGRLSLLRIYERSGGNPFFALELARASSSDGGPIDRVEVPQTLEELIRTRISGLPASTRQALALTSAVGTASESLLERAGVAAQSLEPAIVAQVIDREEGTIRFTHPLLSSVLYQALGEDRWRIHAELAEIVEDPLVRARHLALSMANPETTVARVIDNAARLAADRGASAIAAELFEHALRLTPLNDVSDRHGRSLAAARANQAAGEWTRARAIATDLVARAEHGSKRAEALILLAEVGTVDRAVALLEEALAEAATDLALQSVIRTRLAWASRFRRGYVRALEDSRTALELAKEVDDDVLYARANVVRAILAWFVGDPDAPPLPAADLPARAHEFAAAVGGQQLVQEATLAVANTLATSCRTSEARTLLEHDYREWRERDEPRSARSLWGLAWVEFWAGHWELAAAYASQAHEIAIQYGIEVPQDHLPTAVIAVHRGELELARDHSERALELADEQFGLRPPQHLAVLGLVRLWGGDASAGAEWLAKADYQAAALQWGEPTVRWWTSDYVEALLDLGRIDNASRITDCWAADAARLRRDWVLAHVTRCRGLIAAARGNLQEALESLARAVILHERVEDQFGHARSLLALGSVRRRDRQKRSARDAIEAALTGFQRLGALVWERRAQAELGRIGGRTHVEGLTNAELRVAELVAEGRTNREVAAALSLGERTVSSHLTNVYAKLGVRSRTQLARRLS